MDQSERKILVSVVIPNYHRDISGLLSSIPAEYETIVVDNDAYSLAEKRNLGLAKAQGELVYFVDDDNLLDPEAIKKLVQVFKYWEDVGIAASVAESKFTNTVIDGGSKRWLFSGFQLGIFPKTRHPYLVDEVANAFMVRKAVFHQVGGFDYQRFPMDMDEADLCLRARRAGWKVVYVPASVVYHPIVPRVPKFRRKKSAYYMGRNRVLFQEKHLPGEGLGYYLWLVTFFPVFVVVYIVSLVLVGQTAFIPAFLKGVLHGLQGKFGRSTRY